MKIIDKKDPRREYLDEVGYKTYGQYYKETCYLEFILFNEETKRVESCADEKNSFSEGFLEDFTTGTIVIPPETFEEFKKAYPESEIDKIDFLSDRGILSVNKMKAFYMYLYPKHPQVKDLVKLDPYLLKNVMRDWIYPNSWNDYKGDEDNFDKLFHHGTTLCEIIGIPENILELATANSIKRISLIKNLYDSGVEDEEIYRLIAAEALERNLHFVEVITYLREDGMEAPERYLFEILKRADLFQALDADTALTLLYWNIKMSMELDKKPDFESNSLRRDFDVLKREQSKQKSLR